MTTTSTATHSAPSMADRAYETLRDRLIFLDIAPGEPIIEAELAQDLGLGRTPIREAIKRLETDHLTVSYPRRGTFATQVDITQLVNISEVRKALEPQAAATAAKLLGGRQRERLKELLAQLKQMSPTDSHRDLLTLDIAVHRSVYAATDNPFLEETLVRLDNLATRTWAYLMPRLPAIYGHITEHAALIESILDGDADTAASYALNHVVEFEKTVRSAL